jgi:uncharacterized protein YwbE
MDGTNRENMKSGQKVLIVLKKTKEVENPLKGIV